MTTSFKDKYGSYAIVIGASAGIGEALAREIASRGVNLILIARRRDKLERLARELKMQFGVEARSVPVDVLEEHAIDQLVAAVADLDLGLLVINAAAVLAGAFLKNPVDRELDLVRLNILMPARVAHRFGNRLKQKGRGGILFVSSLAGAAPTPYQASYAATKAYLSSFGQAIAFELASAGIDVSVVAPAATDTEGLKATPNIDYSKMKGLSVMSPADVAKTALDGLGRQTYIVPGAKNRMSAFVLSLLPRGVAIRTIGKMTAAAINPAAL